MRYYALQCGKIPISQNTYNRTDTVRVKALEAILQLDRLCRITKPFVSMILSNNRSIWAKYFTVQRK